MPFNHFELVSILFDVSLTRWIATTNPFVIVSFSLDCLFYCCRHSSSAATIAVIDVAVAVFVATTITIYQGSWILDLDIVCFVLQRGPNVLTQPLSTAAEANASEANAWVIKAFNK